MITNQKQKRALETVFYKLRIAVRECAESVFGIVSGRFKIRFFASELSNPVQMGSIACASIVLHDINVGKRCGQYAKNKARRSSRVHLFETDRTGPDLVLPSFENQIELL